MENPEHSVRGEESPGRSDHRLPLRDQTLAIRIAFGHQSVGEDILNAIGDFERGDQLVVRSPDYPELQICHRRIGENGRPLSKIDDFVEWVESGPGAWAEIALFKFCYVDISAETDLEGLFQAKHRALRHLQRRFPETRFLQSTVPLTVNPRLIDRLVVGMRRRSRHPALLANMRRNEFNARLRATTHLEFPLFDLAALESRDTRGARAALDRDLARDHGHLTDSASAEVGAEFVKFIAKFAHTRASDSSPLRSIRIEPAQSFP